MNIVIAKIHLTSQSGFKVFTTAAASTVVLGLVMDRPEKAQLSGIQGVPLKKYKNLMFIIQK